jgi:hypothetical protein
MGKVYIVGEVIEEDGMWHIHGVFSSEQAAVDLCGENENRFVGPYELDGGPSDNDKVIPWPSGYYPVIDGLSS